MITELNLYISLILGFTLLLFAVRLGIALYLSK